MLFRTQSAAVYGIDANLVDVEVDLTPVRNETDTPATVTIVGLPDLAVRESRERIRAAINNSAFFFPFHKTTINLAPADVRKEGASFDLPIALGILGANGDLGDTKHLTDILSVGELSLDGRVRPIRGALPIALRRKEASVHACELNPVSFSYLVRNIRLNRVSNVVPLLGDCREVAPRGVADWVLMGHFDAREYLDVAFSALRGKGTILYHELCPKEQYPDAMTRRLAAAARANWRDVVTIRTRIVKSFAPGILHVAAELEVRRQARG